MMGFRSGLIILLFISFSSCKKKVEIREVQTDGVFKTILIDTDDIDKKNMAQLSEIADSVIYIPLQTTDDALIGKIDKLIVWNDLFYIWDSMNEAIFCFDSEGKFLHKIAKQGTGPDEYPRILNFSINKENGNIYIYSDMAQAIYKYTKDGYFIKKIPLTLIISSFAIQKEDIFLCYARAFPNMEHYQSSFPEQCRYMVVQDNVILRDQLKFKYNKNLLKVALPRDNFSFYRDTILLTEFMKPEIYSIDSTGILTPRYKVEFSTNTFYRSFDEDVDLQQMESKEKSGSFTTLFGSFYETDNYILMNYARGLIGTAYVNKRDNTIHNMGYFLFDDINKMSLNQNIVSIDEKGNMYKLMEPQDMIDQSKRIQPSLHLQNVIKKIEESYNPVIVKIKLK